MSEQILHDYMPGRQNLDKLKGTVTVELFDAKTNKKVLEYSSTNFIANFAKEYFRYLERVNFRSQMSSLSSGSDTDVAPYGSPLTAIVLSDCADEPDPDYEWTLAGNLIGYSTKANYSGADTLRGTPNGQFCETSTGSTKWTFDWPTHSGNGTIRSISWMPEIYQLAWDPGSYYFNLYQLYLPSVLNNGSTLLADRSSPFTGNQPIALLPGNRLATGQGTTVSVFEENNTPVTTFTTISCSGLTWDKISGKLWVISGSQIASYSQTGTLIDGPISITARSYRGLTFDGTDLWTIASGVVYQISLTGSNISNFTPSFGALSGGTDSDTSKATAVCDIAWDEHRENLVILASGYASWRYGFGYSYNPFYHLCTQIYSRAGTKLSIGTRLNPWNGGVLYFVGTAYDRYFDITSSEHFVVSINNSGSGYATGSRIMNIRADGMGSRMLLPSSITKTSAHTLRISYTLTYPT